MKYRQSHVGETIQFLSSAGGKHTLAPRTVARRKRIEQAPKESDECDPLPVCATRPRGGCGLAVLQLLVTVSVAQCPRGQIADDFAELQVLIGKRRPVAKRAEEHRADHCPAPHNGYHGDGLRASLGQGSFDVFQRRIGGGVRNEYRFARFQCAFQLGISLEIDDVITDRWVFIRRDQASCPATALREKNRTAIQPIEVAELSRDALENVREMQRARDFLENIDDGQEMVAVALQRGDPLLTPAIAMAFTLVFMTTVL